MSVGLRSTCFACLLVGTAGCSGILQSEPPSRLRAGTQITPASQNRTTESTPPRAQPQPELPQTGNEHIVLSDGLSVNGEIITVADVLEPIIADLEELAETLPAELYYRRMAELVRQQIVDAVAQHLIYRRASRTIDERLEPNIKRAVEMMERERINREFGGRETEYENFLQKQGKTRQQVLDRLRRAVIVDSYLRERILPIIPQPRKRELLQYYREHQADYSTIARRELYIIDVPVSAFLDSPSSATPDQRAAAEQAARAAIEEAAAELKRGELFEEVARRHSRFKQSDGGYWGYVIEPLQGRWQIPSKRGFEMGENETSGIIEAADGFFIVHVGRVDEAHVQSFEEAQPDIAERLKDQRFVRERAEFLQRELEGSTIGSLDAFIAQVMLAAPRGKAPPLITRPGN